MFCLLVGLLGWCEMDFGHPQGRFFHHASLEFMPADTDGASHFFVTGLGFCTPSAIHTPWCQLLAPNRRIPFMRRDDTNTSLQGSWTCLHFTPGACGRVQGLRCGLQVPYGGQKPFCDPILVGIGEFTTHFRTKKNMGIESDHWGLTDLGFDRPPP